MQITQRQNRHWEYKSEFTMFGLPFVHVVIGRDPATNRLKTARGIIAVGRIAIGVVALGQVALGVFPVGQVAVGLIFAFGQLAPAGWGSVGQVAVASRLAVGQVVMAQYAVGQMAVAQYGICQGGIGAHIHSVEHSSLEALRAFQEAFPALYGWIAPVIGEKLPAERQGG